jgi:hypothetical protein
MIRFLFFFILLISVKLAISQSFMPENVFQKGEKISYNVMYNIGFLWVDAGKVEFSVDSSSLNNKPVFVFKSSGQSYSDYDWVMKVRESFIAYSECNPIKSIKYARKSTEGTYFANEAYLFDYQNKKIYSEIENSNIRLKKDTVELKRGSWDLLTSIYACRNIDFSKYNIGDVIPLYVLIDNKPEPILIKLLGYENYKYSKGKKIKCIKFSASLVAGTIFKPGDSMKILVTDDKIHLPVYIEANILVGTVKAFLNSFSGLKK